MKTKFILLLAILFTLSGYSQDSLWTVYQKSNSGLNSNLIVDVLEGNDKSIYLATWDKGLIKFDGQTWVNYETNNSGIHSNYVESIAKTANGDLYLAVQGGLNIYDGQNWSFFSNSQLGISHYGLSNIFVDDKDTVYIGSYSDGIIKFYNNNWTNINTTNSNIFSDRIQQVVKNDKNELIVATDEGVSIYKNNKWTNYNKWNSKLPAYLVMSIVKSSDSTHYIGSELGLSILENDSIFEVPLTFNILSSLSFPSLLFSEQKKLYISSEGKAGVFTKDSLLKKVVKFEELLPYNFNSVIQTWNGDIYFTSFGFGLLIYNAERDTTRKIEDYIPVIKDTLTGFQKETIYNNGVTLTPNPFTSQTTIAFTNDSKESFSFVVYDITGKSVFKEQNITSNSFEFNRNNLAPGMYFYNLINTNSNTINTGKLVVQ